MAVNFFLIYPKQNSTTQLPFLGEVRFYRCTYNDKIFSPTTAVPSVLASLWRSFCFQAIWLGKKFKKNDPAACGCWNPTKFLKFCSQNSTTQLPFLGEIRFYRYKNNEKNLSPTAAVPSVLVCGEVFVFKPFGWERNFKKMIQQPVAAGTQRNLTAAGET